MGTSLLTERRPWGPLLLCSLLGLAFTFGATTYCGKVCYQPTTTPCGQTFPPKSSELLDGLKQKACGCFVGGMRRAVRAKEPALVECGAVYVYNYHMPVRHCVCHPARLASLPSQSVKGDEASMHCNCGLCSFPVLHFCSSARCGHHQAAGGLWGYFCVLRVCREKSTPGSGLLSHTTCAHVSLTELFGRCGGNACTISQRPTCTARWRPASRRSRPWTALTPHFFAPCTRASPAPCLPHLPPRLLVVLVEVALKLKSCACEPLQRWTDRTTNREGLPSALPLALVGERALGAPKVRDGGACKRLLRAFHVLRVDRANSIRPFLTPPRARRTWHHINSIGGESPSMGNGSNGEQSCATSPRSKYPCPQS